MKTIADWFFSHSRFAPFLARQVVSVIGHSLGAYTGLALAGGVPTSLRHEHPDRVARVIEVEPDPRVGALVLLAPAVPWFRLRGALSQVHAPILMIASYHDELAPYFVMCPIVQEGVADPRTVLDRRERDRTTSTRSDGLCHGCWRRTPVDTRTRLVLPFVLLCVSTSTVGCDKSEDDDPPLVAIDAGQQEPTTSTTGILRLVYSPMYSAFVEGHPAQLPVRLDRSQGDTWRAHFSSADPSIADIVQTGDGAMITRQEGR